MKKQYFYIIKEGDKYISGNFMEGMTDNFHKAMRFPTEYAVQEFFGDLNNDRDFKIFEVECIIREY